MIHCETHTQSICDGASLICGIASVIASKLVRDITERQDQICRKHLFTTCCYRTCCISRHHTEKDWPCGLVQHWLDGDRIHRIDKPGSIQLYEQSILSRFAINLFARSVSASPCIFVAAVLRWLGVRLTAARLDLFPNLRFELRGIGSSNKRVQITIIRT